MPTSVDVYMTELESGFRLALSMIPEVIKCNHGTVFQSYDIITKGEVKIPKGVKLSTFRWSGTLPGEKLKDAGYIKSHHWKSPKSIQKIWNGWKDSGTVIRLMVTGTPINNDVYLDDFDVEYAKGNGDFGYSIGFCSAVDLRIYTVAELGIKLQTANNLNDSRPSNATSGSYTVKAGDSLWKIAQQQLGSGSRWPEIYALNKDQIKDPNQIYPGQVFTLPT